MVTHSQQRGLGPQGVQMENIKLIPVPSNFDPRFVVEGHPHITVAHNPDDERSEDWTAYSRGRKIFGADTEEGICEQLKAHLPERDVTINLIQLAGEISKIYEALPRHSFTEDRECWDWACTVYCKERGLRSDALGATIKEYAFDMYYWGCKKTYSLTDQNFYKKHMTKVGV